MRDEEILMLLGLGLLALSGVKKVEVKKEEKAEKVEKYMTYTTEGVPAPAGVGGAEAPEELARKIQESPHVKHAIENIAISPIEKMLIFEPEQPIQPAVKEESPIQIQPITLSEEMTSSTEKVATQVMPQIEYKAPPEKIDILGYEPECVPLC